MVASISGSTSIIMATRMQAETRRQESVKAASDSVSQAADVDSNDDATPAALQQKLADMADDMASVATQFRNRREFEKKANANAENFDGVLEEDAEPKAKKLIEVTAVQQPKLDFLMAQARNLFPDDSDLVLVLRELLKREKLSVIQRKQLESVLQTVTQEADPKMLKAGINCALKARLFGSHLGVNAMLLRQTYRRFLENDGSPLEDYEEWISSYGHKSRHIVLEFVEQSLGIDIRSEDPSCNHLEFSYLLAHMRKLILLRTADRDFVFSLLEKKLVPPYVEEESDWLLLFFSLLKKQLSYRQLLLATLNACLLPTKAQRSAWLNAVRSAYKRLPRVLQEQVGAENSEQNEQMFVEVVDIFDQLIEENYAAEILEQRRLP